MQPGQVPQFDLSDTSAAQLGGRAIAVESAGREAREALAAQQAAETYTGAGGGRGFVNPALAGSLAGAAQDNSLFSRVSMNEYWSGDDILSRGMRAAGNTIYDVAEALTPADSTPQEVQRARELGQLRQSFNAAREAGDIGEMQKLQARHAQITSAEGNPSLVQVSMASDILRVQIAQGLPADRYSLGLAAGAAITQGFAGMVAPTAGGPIAGVNGVGTAKPLFGNIYPEHVIDSAKIVPNERLRGISGNFNYVITEQGTLIVGRSGHTSLTGGAPVQAAGELQLYNGNVKWIDNASGHYQPSSNIGSVAETAFNNAGLDATGKFMPKVWVPNPTLPRGGLMGKNELIIAFQAELAEAERVLDTQYSFELAEPHYRKCLSLIEHAPAYQSDLEKLLLDMYLEKTIGDEPLAYLMYVLRWPNIRTSLESKLANDPKAIATGQAHEKVLSAYDDEWANKEFYKFGA